MAVALIIGSPSALQVVVGVLGACTVSWASYRLRFLTAGGAGVQWFIGVIVFGCGGWPVTVPILAFFVVASALSKFADARRHPVQFNGKGSTRDALQVLANGGIAAGLILLGLVVHDQRVYLAYVGALAAASSDTIATEIGTLYGKRPRLITTGQIVESGTSGAVTLPGLLGGLGGAGLLVISALPWLGGAVKTSPVVPIFAGFCGGLVDSVLGCSLQARFVCHVCGKGTESPIHCNAPTRHVRGLRSLTNDAVNIVCTAVGAASCVLLS